MHGYIAFRRVERDLYLKICGRAVEHGDQLITSLGACGMYRPPIGPVSAIERAIVCMRMPGLADLRQPISRGFLHTATSGAAPGFFLRAVFDAIGHPQAGNKARGQLFSSRFGSLRNVVRSVGEDFVGGTSNKAGLAQPERMEADRVGLAGPRLLKVRDYATPE